MKERIRLRNKKTGQIVDLLGTERSCPYITIGVDFHDGNPKTFDYTSLNQLNEEWEDVKEPLIEDEKIRKAVRAWAEINEICGAKYGQNAGACWFCFEDYRGRETTNIGFLNRWALDRSEIGKAHTIEELCGEEEA